MTIPIPDQIAQACISKFLKLNKLPSSQEFTILSGIVLELEFENKVKEFKCISIGTGMKCLPNSKLFQTKGQYLLDSHSEVITRRGFIKFLITEITNCIQCESKFIKFNKETKLFEFNDCLKSINFYSSQSPCGDASLEALDQITIDTRLQHDTKRIKLSYDNNVGDGEMLRGRNKFELKGKCRTKPGRVDSEPTLSMSCSDKLAIWNLLGIQGSLLNLFMHPIYLDRIIVGDLFNFEGLNRALINRLKSDRKIDAPFKLNEPEILKTEVEFKFSKYRDLEGDNNDKLKSCAISLSWYLNIPQNKPELIVKGLKQGSKLNYVNNEVPIKNRSELCPLNLSKSLYQLIPLVNDKTELSIELPKELNYKEFKLLNKKYENFKDLIKNGELKGWQFKDEDYYKFCIN